MIALEVHPRTTVTFGEFCEVPGPAVALDGYVEGPSRFSHRGPHANFNHHEGVDRLGTRSTCEQVALATRSGLWDALGGRAAVHVNDCDADVSLSVWLLANPGRVSEDRVDLLVAVEGSLDATGGCISCSDDEDLLDEMTWVFAPYNQWRTDPGCDDSAEGISQVIAAVGERVTAFADGNAGAIRDSDDYRVLARSGQVCVVEERGPLARIRMHRDGVKVFVSARRVGDRTVVSVGKASPYTPVDLGDVWRELNLLEGCRGPDRWGGSDLIGGSPRLSGTELPVTLIMDVVASLFRSSSG